MASAKTRTEHDLLGDLEVPADAYYGVQTARALENFQISGIELRQYPNFIKALAMVKLAAARANFDTEGFSKEILSGIEKANSAEFEPTGPDPVIATMADQQDVVAGERDMGGTMRLGLWPTKLKKGSVAAKAYGEDPATERHRHRYEVNNTYRPQLEAAGLVFSGTSPDGNLVEIAELPESVHPFFVGTQAHPEFRSRPTRAHPLFAAFVAASVKNADSRMLPLQP